MNISKLNIFIFFGVTAAQGCQINVEIINYDVLEARANNIASKILHRRLEQFKVTEKGLSQDEILALYAETEDPALEAQVDAMGLIDPDAPIKMAVMSGNYWLFYYPVSPFRRAIE